MIRPPVQTLQRAFDLLFALEHAGRPTRLADLSRATGIHKATAQRLLIDLEQRGMVRREESGYCVGLAAVPLANAFFLGNSLTRVTLPVLQSLAAATGETVSLYQKLGFTRVLIQRIDGLNPLHFNMPIGQRLPLHLGGGKVLAAAMPEDELNRMLEAIGEIKTVTGQVWSREEFLEKLRQIRERGFDVAVQERALGAASVVVPVVLSDGTTLAALSVVCRDINLDARKSLEFSLEARRAARRISELCSASRLENAPAAM